MPEPSLPVNASRLVQLALRTAPAPVPGRQKRARGPRQSDPGHKPDEEPPPVYKPFNPPGVFHIVVVAATTGPQPLLLAFWRDYRFGRVDAEGIVLGSALSASQAEAVRTYAKKRRSSAQRPRSYDERYVQCSDVEGFLSINGPLYRRAVKGQARTAVRLLVGYDLPFCLSRFCRLAGRATRKHFRGGFLMLFAKDPDVFRLRARQVNDHLVLLEWDHDRFMWGDGVLPGRLADLRHIGGALTGTSGESFGALCQQFDVDDPGPAPRLSDEDPTSAISLVAWARQRLEAEVALWKKALADIEQWRQGGAHSLRPEWVYSSGSLARNLLGSAGYRGPAGVAKLAPEVAGAFAGAFYGGRAEANLLRQPVPMVICDFSACYVTCAYLLGISELLAAERITAEDVTEELRDFLSGIEKDLPAAGALSDPSLWRRWGGTVALVEAAGEVLPYRVITGPAEVHLAVGSIKAPAELPYTWPDLVAAALKGGKAPKVSRAWRLVPEGRRRLRPVQLLGSHASIGTGEDVFAALLAARAEVQRAAVQLEGASSSADRDYKRWSTALKRVGNTAAFGNAARLDRAPAPAEERQRVLDPWGHVFEPEVNWAEEPDRWTFLPAAASVTAGARLLMAMAERAVTDAGGTVAAVHTDSIMVPSSPEGGLWACPGGPLTTEEGRPAVRLLPWASLQGLLAHFDRLRPDHRPAWKVGEHKTTERPLHVEVFGANRYVVFDPASGEVVHGTETGLGGVLLDPSGRADARLTDGRRAWVADVQTGLVAQGRGPGFLDELAVSVWRASTPEQLRYLRALPGLSEAQPFSPFLLAHPSRLASLRHNKRARAEQKAAQIAPGSPIAAFCPDPGGWPGATWCRRDGTPVRLLRSSEPAVASGYPLAPGSFVAATVAEVLGRTWATGLDVGTRPAPGVHRVAPVGLVVRPPAEALDELVLVGREGDKMLEEACGVLVDPGERLTVYTVRGDYTLDVRSELVRALAARFRARLGATDGEGLASRTLRAFLGGRPLKAANAQALLARLDDVVLEVLLNTGVDPQTISESPRPVRYELCRRLAESEAVVSNGKVKERCALPGCAKPRRKSYPYCSREHERQGAQGPKCGYPPCDRAGALGGGFCSKAHRDATAKLRARAERRGDPGGWQLRRIAPRAPRHKDEDHGQPDNKKGNNDNGPSHAD